MSSMSMSVLKAITMCGERYGFDVSEAMEMLKRSGGKGKSVLKSSFALPYNGELNESLCLGLNRNSGVYSQCSSERVGSSEKYCKQCLKEASNNSHGLPNYGNIVDRQRAYLNKEEFKDPSGKSQIAYTKIMKKLKLSEEQVRNECEKMGVTLDPINLEEKIMKKSGRPKQIKPEKPAKEIKAKGRPKKSKKVLELAGEEEDLFASLVMSSLASSTSTANSSQVTDSVGQVPDSVEDAVVIVETVSVSEPKKEEAEIVLSVSETKATVSETKKEKKSSSAKEEKALAKLKEKEEKELAKLKEKEEKELAKLKEKEAKEEKAKEKEMKSLMLKLEKEKQKEELIEKKAALALEKVKAKELKEKKVSEKKVKKSKIDDDDVRPTPAFVDPPVDEEADVVKKIIFEGKKYLKSKKTGIVYNMDQDVIGKWNEEKQRIDLNEEEESEDEYDEDDC